MQAESILEPKIGWLVLAIFGIGWVFLGWFWGRKAKNLEGFMLAGRNVGLALGSATAMATWVTSNTIMLAPKFALQMGLWGMVAYSTASFGLFLFAPMAMRIRTLLPRGYTSGDFVRLRYGKIAWILFIIISLVYSMAWLMTMATAGGVVLQALSGISYRYGMTVILVVCVLYTLFGGLYAVIGTDFIQSVIILIGVVIVGYFVGSKVEFGEVYANLSLESPMLVNALMPVALLALFNNMFFGFGEVFHNNVWWSRAFAMRDNKTAGRAFFLAGIFWLPIPIAAGFIALCAGSLGINIIDADMSGPLVVGKILGSAGAVLIFSVVFCSLGSSIDSLLAATSDLLTEDIYRKIFNPKASEKLLKKASAFIIILLGVVTWAFCFSEKNDLIQLLFFSGPLVASTIFPIIGGLYWAKASATGASVAMLSGSIIGLLVYNDVFNLNTGWFCASLVSTIVSMLVMLIFTLLNNKNFNWQSLEQEN